MIVSIRRILLPTDFSEPAKEAAQYAMALCEQFHAELHLLHAVPQVMPLAETNAAWVMTASETQAQLEAAEECLLKDVVDQQFASNHRIVRKSVIGFAVDEILQYAKENEIDLIVIGTHGYRWLAHALIGSVAEKVVRMASCPVLTVHPKGHQFVTENPAESNSADQKK